MKKTTFAASVATASVGLLLLAAPLAASAHVHVTPDQAEPGSYSNLTFQVPTESASAGTVKFVVDLPTATPFTSVTYQAIPGWRTTVDTEKLAKPVTTSNGTITEAPVRVTWTADSGTEVGPGQFQQFTISAGAVPKTGKILLPAHQYYSDGTVVDWAEPTPASGKEPEHPAPTLYVTDPAPSDPDSGAAPLVTTSTPGPAATAAGSTAAAVSVGLGVAGLAVGAIALVVSVFALTRAATQRKARG